MPLIYFECFSRTEKHFITILGFAYSNIKYYNYKWREKL